MDAQIRDWVEATPLIDTHEHLIEESARVSGKLYQDSLIRTGMPIRAFQWTWSARTDPESHP